MISFIPQYRRWGGGGQGFPTYNCILAYFYFIFISSMNVMKKIKDCVDMLFMSYVYLHVFS